MSLLPDDELERSAVVANRRMNRERGLLGSNGYDRELGHHPLDFLKGRLVSGGAVAWLDVCGTGKALIEFPAGSRIKRSVAAAESAIYVTFEGREVPIFEEPGVLMVVMAQKGKYGLRPVGVEERYES